MDRGYVVERKSHPKDTCNIWSLLTFTYIHEYIKRGNKRDLNEDDIPKVWTSLQSKGLGDKMEKMWDNQKTTKGKKKSIVKLLCDCFLKKYLMLGLFQLGVNLFYVSLTPYSVGKLVNYFKEGQTEITKDQAWIYGGIVILTNTIFLFYEHHYHLLKAEMGTSIVSAFSSMMYRKSLRLGPSQLAEISNGKIVTAITKDVVLIDDTLYVLNDLWVEIIQSFVVLYLLYIKLGASSAAGLSTVLVMAVLQIFVATLIFKVRDAANAKTDERIQLTQEIITAIRVLKMYAWETFFEKKIIQSRKIEVQKLRVVTILKFVAGFFGNLADRLSFLLVILFYVWFGHTLDAETVYYISTCYYRLRKTIAYIIPTCSASLAEFAASLRRIEYILSAEEIEKSNQDIANSVIIPKVDFISAEISVGKIQILKDVNMKLKPGLNVLVGPVGCGKSSLLKAILREYTVSDGKMQIEGTVSFSPQNPWLFPSSIKQNILFGQTYNEPKYNKIVEACALSFDLAGLAEGDETILNDCGVNLSKGQEARVNIARALYKDSEIYVFDDSLSALDNHVKNYIFENSILDYLKDKLVILATHDRKFMNKADNVIVMLDGTVTYSGKPTDIPRNLTQSLESLDKQFDESAKEDIAEIKEVDEEQAFCNEDTELITADKVCSSVKANIYHEKIHTGSIGWKNYKKYFDFGGGFLVFFIVFGMYAAIEIFSGLSEKLLSHWVSLEEKMDLNAKNFANHTTIPKIWNVTEAYLINTTSSFSAYITDSIGTSTRMFNETTERTFANSAITITGVENSSTKYEDALIQRSFYVNWYSTLLITSCVMSFVASSIFFVFSLKISKNLHKSMITNVLGAKMSFFDVNMSGNIINRFSKDLFNIDEWLPYIIHDAISMLTLLTSTGLLIATINMSFTVMTVVLILIFILGCKYCIRPATALRRLDMATRSPMIGHLNSTLEGLSIIRSYGTQNILVEEFDKHQDHYVATDHLCEIVMRCLSFSLHMLSAAYIAIIILRFLLVEAESSSDVGLAITQSFVLSNFLDYGIRQWVMLECMMTNFQRAAEYTEIEQEQQTGQVMENWPSEGCIKYQNVSLTYREFNETVLRNLNFVIKPREKIGIVGRTGAGKSSIIVTLFRLYEVVGDILIDDVNIKTLPLEYLRNRVCIIPQDPILFSGSVRANIDPLNKHSDSEIWQALSAVNLKAAINNLDEDVDESGIMYSVGQRQLLCLARAIIRKTKVIILDEATANMDEETDEFVHRKIEELFEDCTTITVAHRLHSVMRCDRVIVMDKGEIIEFESPNTLLENKDSTFYKMVHHHENSR